VFAVLPHVLERGDQLRIVAPLSESEVAALYAVFGYYLDAIGAT
jgi:hypothetical protein